MIFGEELSAIHYPIAVIYGTSCNLYGVPIIHFGTSEQQKKFLKPIMDGSALGALGITEPTAGSDAIGGMRTMAVKKGDKYIINGEKRFITNGSAADYIVLYVVTNDQVKRSQGISALIFETDTPGFKVVKDYKQFVDFLEPPRPIFLSLPAGPTIDSVINDLLPFLDNGDVILDGGNSYYKDSIRRASELAEKGIYFVDCGTSGGWEGAR